MSHDGKRSEEADLSENERKNNELDVNKVNISAEISEEESSREKGSDVSMEDINDTKGKDEESSKSNDDNEIENDS